MTAPSIEMIAELLKNCSLGRNRWRGRTAASPQPTPAEGAAEDDITDESETVTVELNSEVALPYYWEQCLDMRTGEVYYINWRTGTRTTEDPRIPTTCSSSIDCLDSSSGDNDEDAVTSSDDEDTRDTACSSGISSLSSQSSSEATSAEPEAQVLVAAGCKACFMYVMVPKRLEACPRCGGELLHLGREGCF